MTVVLANLKPFDSMKTLGDMDAVPDEPLARNKPWEKELKTGKIEYNLPTRMSLPNAGRVKRGGEPK
jgi:hypothetical protein